MTAPVAIRSPGCSYPLPWSVQTWLIGHTANERDPAASTGFARDLAGFIADVRAIDVGGRAFSGRARWRSANTRRVDAGMPASQ
jgi:aminoglycoside phosphotransferase (APT) family kinase protein